MVLTITKCSAKDCKNINKLNLECNVNHEFSKGKCLQYEMDLDYFNANLKDYLRGLKK